MSYFPLFVELKDKKCIVAGGGRIAARKISMLLKFGASVVVIAPRFSNKILEIEETFTIIRHRLRLPELLGAFLVIAATDDPFTNRQIAGYCKKNGIFADVIDSAKESSFLFPAVIEQAGVTVGITTSGKSPLFAGYLKREIEKAIPDYAGSLADSLGRCRATVKKRVKEEALRKKIYTKLLKIGLENNGKITEEMMNTVIKNETKH